MHEGHGPLGILGAVGHGHPLGIDHQVLSLEVRAGGERDHAHIEGQVYGEFLAADHGHGAVVKPAPHIVAVNKAVLQGNQVIQGLLDLGVTQIGGHGTGGRIHIQERGAVGIHERQDGILVRAVGQLSGLAVHGLGQCLADGFKVFPGPLAVPEHLVGSLQALQLEQVPVEHDVERVGLQRDSVGLSLPAEGVHVHVVVVNVLFGNVVVDTLGHAGKNDVVQALVIHLE